MNKKDYRRLKRTKEWICDSKKCKGKLIYAQYVLRGTKMNKNDTECIAMIPKLVNFICEDCYKRLK